MSMKSKFVLATLLCSTMTLTSCIEGVDTATTQKVATSQGKKKKMKSMEKTMVAKNSNMMNMKSSKKKMDIKPSRVKSRARPESKFAAPIDNHIVIKDLDYYANNQHKTGSATSGAAGDMYNVQVGGVDVFSLKSHSIDPEEGVERIVFPEFKWEL